MRKIILFFTILLFYCSGAYAQLEETVRLQQQLPLIRDSITFVNTLNRLGMLFYEQNADSAFYYTAQARAISERLEYTKGKADATNNLGVVYDIKGNLQLALRYYNDAYNSYKKIQDASNVVQTTMNIAGAYYEMGRYQKSIAGFKKAFELGKNLAHDSIMSLVIVNYILSFPDLITKDSMAAYIDRARRIASKYNDTRLLLAVDQVAAGNMINNGRRGQGLVLLEQTAAKTVKSRLYYLSLDMLIDLGNVYAPADSAKAVGYYLHGLAIARQQEYRGYTILISKKLYDYYLSKKDAATAFHYSQQLLTLHDEQEKTDLASGIDYIDYAVKDEQLASAHVQAAYQSKLLILAVVICVMTIVVIIVLWRGWRQMQKTANTLRLQFEQSESTTEALDVVNKNYANLIKIIAHDLRNPISAISSLSAIIEPEEMHPEEMKELIDLMQVSSKNCLELISELLKADFNPRQNLKKEELSLDDLLQRCVRLLSFRAKDKDQQLLLNNTVGAIIVADGVKLSRVIDNLVVNAIKFSPPGSVICIDAWQAADTISIAVKDNGMGIPASLLDKLFDPFTSSKRKGTGGEQPFGLGLYISKQIIEAHKGEIRVKSEQGKGTTFYIDLPVVSDPVKFSSQRGTLSSSAC